MKNNQIVLFQNRLIYDKEKAKCIYYMDLQKKWKFYTNKNGFLLLKLCFHYVKKILIKYQHDYKINYKLGKEIYSQKNNLKKTGITWTENEYNNNSMRYVYIIVKSFQRFTEMWSLLESFNLYCKLDFSVGNNILSLGCGPGFECLAFKTFYKNNKNIKIYGIDSINKWKSSFEMFGTFYNIDILNQKNDFFTFLKKKKIDIVILSNVYANYMTNKEGTLFIRDLFLHNVKYILINDRSKDLSFFVNEFKKYKIYTYYLINEKDHRQICLSLNSLKKKKDIFKKNIFPNVPFS